jgi:hypothetical protein
VVVAGVFEAVSLEDILRRPFVAAIVVVEVEERASIEGCYVMLLCCMISIAI